MTALRQISPSKGALKLSPNKLNMAFKEVDKTHLVGKTFRNLKVLEITRPNRKLWRARCECLACGRTDYVCQVAWLTHSHTGSCGCTFDRSAHGKHATKAKNLGIEGKMPGYYMAAVNSRSKKLGLATDLNSHYLLELWEVQNERCALSGLPLHLRFEKYGSHPDAASLDRIDSDKGYVRGNVQWLHADVNQMKFCYDQASFLRMCKVITDFNLKEDV